MATDRLFRGGQLHALTPEQLERLSGRDFRLIADLRYAEERRRDPVRWPRAVATPLTLAPSAAGDAPHRALLRQGPLTIERVDLFYEHAYRRLPFDEWYRDLFARAVLRLAHTQARALVYCTAGKDRTGILTALTLHLLGVHRDDILHDYLLSGTAVELAQLSEQVRADVQRRFGYAIGADVARRWLGVQPTYLEAAFATIEERCGSVEAYFEIGGVEATVREQLVRRLLVE